MSKTKEPGMISKVVDTITSDEEVLFVFALFFFLPALGAICVTVYRIAELFAG